MAQTSFSSKEVIRSTSQQRKKRGQNAASKNNLGKGFFGGKIIKSG